MSCIFLPVTWILAYIIFIKKDIFLIKHFIYDLNPWYFERGLNMFKTVKLHIINGVLSLKNSTTLFFSQLIYVYLSMEKIIFVYYYKKKVCIGTPTNQILMPLWKNTHTLGECGISVFNTCISFVKYIAFCGGRSAAGLGPSSSPLSSL